jgi:hypothetical protein
MQKIFKVILGLVTILFLLGTSTVLKVAATESIGQTGNNQYYDVLFDKEGQAAVVAKLNFFNMSDQELKEIVIEIPGNQIRIINMVQEAQDLNCLISPITNQSNDLNQYGEEYPTKIAPTYPPTVCENKYSTIKYQKDQQSGLLKLTLPLPTALQAQKSTSILIYYKADGYVQENMGIYKFSFETIKSEVDIDSVRVAVNIQNGLYLKKGKADVNYQPNWSTLEMAGDLYQKSSPALKSLSSSVESIQAGFVKTTSNLDPGENFVVQGKYYRSSFIGNWTSYLSVGLVVIILAILIAYIIKKEKEG